MNSKSPLLWQRTASVTAQAFADFWFGFGDRERGSHVHFNDRDVLRRGDGTLIQQ